MTEITKTFEQTPGYNALKNELEHMLEDEAGINITNATVIQLLEDGAENLHEHQIKNIYKLLHFITTLQASARLNRLCILPKG